MTRVIELWTKFWKQNKIDVLYYGVQIGSMPFLWYITISLSPCMLSWHKANSLLFLTDLKEESKIMQLWLPKAFGGLLSKMKKNGL
jgi:hypothetical protein